MTSEFDIKKRNKRILAFFKEVKLDVKLHGNINNPAIIFQNKTVLNCYAHNFYLRFTDKPKGGNILFEHKLMATYNLTEQHIDLLFDWFKNYEHRECFSVWVKNTCLRLSGYNFLNKDKTDPTGRYPVFSEYNFKLYFQEEYAKEILKMYSTKKLPLELV